MSIVVALLGALRASLRTRTDLALENLALRQPLVLLRRYSKRPQFGRLLFGWLREKTGTVLGATLLHAAFNLYEMVLQASFFGPH